MAWVVLVTGGSRGFGRALALAFAANKASADDGDLHLHLWSRDAAGMAATAADVTAAWQRQTSHSIHVTQTVVDLSDDSTYGPAIDTFVEEAQAAASVDRVVVFHNAGSLGQVGRIAEVASPQVIRRHMELNVNSVLWINKRLLQVYGTQAQAAKVPSPVLYLINVSSLNAIEPFATCGLYCVFKAARDMHFRVVATEEDATRVKCLNYAPGPMQTEMGNEIRDGHATDPALQRMFKKLQADGTYVDVNVSAQLCVSHVFGPTLVSGSHVDYYDIYQG
ncbi:sepiapterin reductase, variant [Aphanomyces astaci]|uniref:Sepiapterin reductase, variant n=1 Tax=Aphanomyces astaci TaxID=112090 RepID=W4GCS4_APHAT|nr:sepiapterin reductase, variant [Aphanomyces astaci]ETV77487.1 sepiapterin reductase, variant [Aphanomyces astaci]|eukprot:XP_009833274.1 sepiapterin reductase, variant [Aphanomyces astaci]